MRRVAQVGIELIKAYEGLGDGDPSTVNLDPYLCPAGYWTIGWGHSISSPAGIRLTKDNCTRDAAFALYPGGITLEEAEKLLDDDLKPREEVVQRLVSSELNDNQFAALVSFVYNVGAGDFARSTLLKKLNLGDYEGAADQFLRWTKITVKRPDGALVKEESDGLKNRRKAERMRFVTPLFKAPVKLRNTPEIRGNIVAAAGTAAGTLNEMAANASTVYQQLHVLGINYQFLTMGCTLLTLFGLAYSAYSKVKARNEKGTQ